MRLKNLTFLLTMVLSVASCIGWSGTGDSEEYVCVAAFEEYSSQMGADSILTAAQIFNYDLIFTAKVDEAEGYQGGTMLSKRNDSTVYSVYGEGGAFDSDVYAVFYENPSPSRMPAHDILFYRSTLGTCRLHGCMVNNTRQTVDAIINGSGSMRKFEEGDWLKLTATGYNDSTETASKSIFLLSTQKEWTLW